MSNSYRRIDLRELENRLEELKVQEYDARMEMEDSDPEKWSLITDLSTEMAEIIDMISFAWQEQMSRRCCMHDEIDEFEIVSRAHKKTLKRQMAAYQEEEHRSIYNNMPYKEGKSEKNY